MPVSSGHEVYSVHVDGTRVVCEAAALAGVRRIVMTLDQRQGGGLSTGRRRRRRRRPEADRPRRPLALWDARPSSTRPIPQFIARDIARTPAGGLNVVDAGDMAALMPVAMSRAERPAPATWSPPSTGTFAELFGRLESLAKVPRPKVKIAGATFLSGLA
jgi:hypothetical protein